MDVSGTDLLKRGDRFPGEEPGVRFEWIPLDRLPEIDLEPEFLKTQVKNPPEHTELITVQG